jgi:hypothetical protein
MCVKFRIETFDPNLPMLRRLMDEPTSTPANTDNELPSIVREKTDCVEPHRRKLRTEKELPR